jgi:CHAT domain-containing protein
MRALALVVMISAVVPTAQDDVDPTLRAAVERFYAVQESEDIPGYLALWSSAAQRPLPAQLKSIFDSGDDKFSELQIKRVTRDHDRAVVHVSVTRDRSMANMRRADGSFAVAHSVTQWALTYVKESDEWKLLREGPAGEALADALVSAASAADREAVLAADPDLVNPALVTSVARRADAFAISMQYPAAERIYGIAIEIAARVGDKRGEGEGWQNVGNALYFQRKFAEALAAYARRLAIERERNDDAAIANATLGVATVLYSQFEYSDAIARYREALGIQEHLHDTSGIATTLISTGNVQFVQGDFAGALVDYRRSGSLFRQVSDTRGAASATEGVGRTLAALGDLAGALNAYASVLQEGQARSDRGLQANAFKSIGEVHFRLGNLAVARSNFDQARAHYDALHDTANVGRVWHAIGLTDLVAQRFTQAEQDYGNSMAACSTGPASQQDPDCIARGLVGIAFAQAAEQRYELAVASYRRGIAAFYTLKRAEDAARAEVGLSQALYGMKNYVAALAAAAQARDHAAGLRRDDVLWRALVAEARADRAVANRKRAMDAARSAVAAIQRLAAEYEELPIEPVAADTTNAFALLAVLQAESGDAGDAYRTVEQKRAHALRIALAPHERDIHRGMTEGEREEERRLAIEVTSVAAQIRNETQLPRPDSARIARLEQHLTVAKGARHAARERLFNRDPMLGLWRGLASSASAVEALAPFGSPVPLLVELVVGEDDLLAIVVSESKDGPLNTDAYLTHVASGTLTQRITQLVNSATLQNRDAWHDAATEVVKLIPAAAWTAIGNADRVIIVPDDVLWHVPFEALPFEGGVINDRTAVAYVGSATSLLPPVAAREAANPPIAIASPELSQATKERMTAAAPDWVVGGDATLEARAVAEALEAGPEIVLSGTDATESAFRERASRAGLLHIAAPFRVNSASPLFSTVLLRADPDATAPERDGLLEARELFDLDLPARLAVFSDGTALSMRAAAPALDAVRWAWRAAGVPAIVVPRWSADSAATQVLLEEFYRQMHAGAAADVALQRARAAVRSDDGTLAPMNWAGWMIVGAPEITEKHGAGAEKRSR